MVKKKTRVTTHKKHQAGGDTASHMLRVRLTPSEHQELVLWSDELDVSEYVRLAIRRYRGIENLSIELEQDLEARALTTFECNILATVNPEFYLDIGGAELTKPPGERRKRV
jgi:hypothetical protein